ncbi:hypothetical protein [Streptomyces profundus]|uniref:hypothetical protein n=1 Tax=Streptomyces profundus TaxID=2867410 RepID=UPI001D16A1F3|nr:hypothetical protein [Streptomyces sp. MA3_2.13]UED84471.1 hypothetical protein K4G22_09855 [Streptomyces sp. MA3_2.13]
MGDLYVEYQSVIARRHKVRELHGRLLAAGRTVRNVRGDELGVAELVSVLNDAGEDWERETGKLAEVFDRAVDSLGDVLEHFRAVDEEMRQRARRTAEPVPPPVRDR